MNALTSKISELKDARKSKDTTLADTTKIRVEMKKTERQLDEIRKQVKELCGESDGTLY